MSVNKKIRIGPIPLTTTLTTNLISPPTISGGVNPPSGTATYLLITHVRVINKTNAAHSCNFWLGASGANAAGTEVIGIGWSIPANDGKDFYSPGFRIDPGEYLVGGADAANALVLIAEGEIGVN